MRAGPDLPAAADAGRTHSEAPPDLSVFFVDLLRSEPALDSEEAHTPRLSPADVERASRITDAEARRLWRASRIAARILLERIGGRGLRGVPFQIEEGGRPFLGAGHPHFSVSHTGRAALIAVSKIMPVGVDLEERKRSLRMSIERRRRLVTAAERIGLTPALAPELDADVLAAWVRLEAVAKASGIGIGRLLTAEGVVGGAADRTPMPARALDVRILSVGEDHIAAIAAERLPNEIEVEAFPGSDLTAFLEKTPL